MRVRADVHLTPRETDVTKRIARGLEDREIADELGIAASTVHVHRDNVYRKTGVRNRTELALWWLMR